MKRTIKSVAALLAFTLLLTITGCRLSWPFSKTTGKTASSAASSAVSAASQAASASSAAAKSSFALPVVLGKSLNPLTTDSMLNLDLWPLLFDSLAEPDAGYNTQWGLATSADIRGTTVTVHLRSDVKFTDGTLLTAKDVVYSYNEVRGNTASYFYTNTADIANVAASGSYTVVFTLKTPDALFANLLNIPIIKSGSDTAAVPAGGTPCPVGSGRYSFSTDSLNGTLTANKSWYKGAALGIPTIRLVNMLDSSTALSSLKTGVFHYLYADSSGAGVATVGLSTASVSLNRMIFLGVNWSNASLANAHVRRAVSMAIDRSSLVSEVYSSRAKVSALPFNPDWSALASLASSASSSSSSAASSSASSSSAKSASSAASSDAAGTVNRADVTSELVAGGVPAKSGSTAAVLSFRLLIDSDNAQMVAAAKTLTSSLAPSGIAIVTDAEPAASYVAKLGAGQFDLYLGEIRLTDDMNIAPLFQGGAAGYGAPAQSSTQTAFSGWQAGTVTLASLVETFRTEMPFIPLCFRVGTVAYSPSLKGTIAPTASDIFLGMENWHFGG